MEKNSLSRYSGSSSATRVTFYVDKFRDRTSKKIKPVRISGVCCTLGLTEQLDLFSLGGVIA